MTSAAQGKPVPFNVFLTDAAGICFSSLGHFLSTKILFALKMFTHSCESDYRSRLNILHDYTRERDVLSACKTIDLAVTKYWNYMETIAEKLSNASYAKPKHRAYQDSGDRFMKRIEVADQEFASDYKQMHDAIIKVLRPLKCSDPVALYTLLDVYLFSVRFDNISRYFSDGAPGFRRGEPLANLRYLPVREPLQLLIQRCNFHDKSGRELHFVFDLNQLKEYQRRSSKKSWQIKYRDNPPVLINVYDYFYHEDLFQATWQLETHLLSLSTIDKINELGDGYDTEYRNSFAIKRIQTCASLCEQSYLYSTLVTHRWTYLPQVLRSYIDAHARIKYIHPKHKPTPVFAYRLDYKRDKNGNPIIVDGRPVIAHPKFYGVWNSLSEASVELDIKYSVVQRAFRSKNGVDEQGRFVFYSLYDFVHLTYDSLFAAFPDIAHQMAELLPEYNLEPNEQSNIPA